ncbi:MAG: hypothetical protein HC933_05770 [Pleurocapsa sp. SU_196_0]|nr:hypothetical protein [Pleurocapsa sp. SU_196_0]
MKKWMVAVIGMAALAACQSTPAGMTESITSRQDGVKKAVSSFTTPKIAGGGAHTLALKANGTVASWGGNDFGQLGVGNNIAQASPITISGLINITEVAAGDFFSLALKADWDGSQLGKRRKWATW